MLTKETKTHFGSTLLKHKNSPKHIDELNVETNSAFIFYTMLSNTFVAFDYKYCHLKWFVSVFILKPFMLDFIINSL